MRLRSQAGRSAPIRLVEQAPTAVVVDPLGAMLIERAGLSRDDLDRIAAHQARTGMPLADAAVDLGLVAPETVSRVAGEQAHGRLVDPADSNVSPAVVAAFDPTDPLALKLRPVRSTLFAPDDMRGPNARILVLVGIGSDDTPGIAANLAVLVAQLGFKGLLVDANFAAPTQHNLFGLDNVEGVTAMLVGGSVQDARVVATSVANLDVLPAGAELGPTGEMVERASLVTLLRAMRHGHRFIIVDAGDQPPELIAALARGADGVLLVAERGKTQVVAMEAVLDRLRSNGIEILGSILSR